jgi:hypothetical protein
VVTQGRSTSGERASWLLRLPLETPTIPFEDEASGCTLWLKLDHLLPSGCTKDRMATSIVGHALASGEVSPSTVVVEASSGSTSIALSMVCATVGVPFRAYMPKTVSGERVLMIRRLGGDVVLTPAEQGMDGAVAAMLRAWATEPDLYAARQFENPRNVPRTGTRPGPSSSRRSASGSTASSPVSAPGARSWAWPTRCGTTATTRSSPGRCRRLASGVARRSSAGYRASSTA